MKIEHGKKSGIPVKAEEQLKNAIALLNAVIDAVSRAESYTEGLQKTMEHVCNITGWNIGEVWEPNTRRDLLLYSNARYASDQKLKAFQQISKEYTFSYGSGLPGRAFRQGVPVIAVTAHAMSGDEQRIRTAGCDDYIAKPLSGKVLLDKITKLVPRTICAPSLLTMFHRLQEPQALCPAMPTAME